MKSIELSTKDIVVMAKVIVNLADTYDNQETVKDCYELNDAFKEKVRDLEMSDSEKAIWCKISRDLRDERIAEIKYIHSAFGDYDEE